MNHIADPSKGWIGMSCCLGQVSADRKMCGVVPAILARGPLRAPVASPKPWRITRHRTSYAPSTVSPFDHSRAWRFPSPPAPGHGETSAVSSRTRKGVPVPSCEPSRPAFLPLDHNQGRVPPLDTCTMLAAHGGGQGDFASPWTHRAGCAQLG